MEVLIEAMQSDELDLKEKAKIAEKLATFESSRAPVISIEHVQNLQKDEETTPEKKDETKETIEELLEIVDGKIEDEKANGRPKVDKSGLVDTMTKLIDEGLIIPFDDEKSIYSLRHFWITIQLLAGKVDVYKISRYAGTSLQQIQRHYDNMKDAEVSKEILSVNFKFDSKNNELIVIDGDSGE